MESSWDSLGIPSTNFSSQSVTEPLAFPLYLRAYVTAACALIFAVGVLGNALVPVLMWRSKELRHSTNLFLLNLSLADTLVLLICLPTSLVELHTIPNTWVLGAAFCHFVPFVEVCVTRASVITLTVISIERYFAICSPLRSTSFCSRPGAVIVCLLIWPVSLLAAGPMFFITEYGEADYGDGKNVSFCFTPITGTMKHYFVGSAIIFFLVPLFFLSVIYFFITRQLLNQKSWMRRRADKAQWHARKQVSLMFGVVIAVFFVCLIPFNAFTIWIIMVPSHLYTHLQPKIYYNLLFAFRILVYVNSAVNPIIYNVMSAKFRIAFLKLFARRGFEAYVPRRRSTLTTTLSSTSSTSSRSNSLREITSHLFPRRLSEMGRRNSHRAVSNSDKIASNTDNASTTKPSEAVGTRGGDHDNRRGVAVGSVGVPDDVTGEVSGPRVLAYGKTSRRWKRRGSFLSPNRGFPREFYNHRVGSPYGPNWRKRCPSYCIDKVPHGKNVNILNLPLPEGRCSIDIPPMKKVSFMDRSASHHLAGTPGEEITSRRPLSEPIYDNWPPKCSPNNIQYYI